MKFLKQMNLPNKLTLIRILLVPVFVLFLLLPFKGSCVGAFIVFVIASYTDHLDGKIARKRNIVTNFGKFLDPVADKILVMSALICIIPMGICHPVALIIILMREFAVSSLRLVAASQSVVIAAGKSGKIKTVFQMVSIGTILLLMCIDAFTKREMHVILVGNILLWLCAAITVYSGIEYIIRNYKLIDTDK